MGGRHARRHACRRRRCGRKPNVLRRFGSREHRRFLQRQNQENGRVSRINIEARIANQWVVVREVTLRNTTDWIDVELQTPMVTSEVRIVALSEVGGHKWASLAEVELYRDFKPKKDNP